MRKRATLVLAVFALHAPAQTFSTLLNFDWTNGGNPQYMSLIQGSDGQLYGTTAGGGTTGYGTVFKTTTSGKLTTLYSFGATGGAFPTGGLAWAPRGTFYGTTEGGGTNGLGTIFQITSTGTLTDLYDFASAEGAYPYTSLVSTPNGVAYGTAELGGANNYGTIFKMSAGGAVTTLHSFDSTDGANPFGTLVETGGNFYGTTLAGGAQGYGTVFEITPSGTLTTLHSFTDKDDGAYPPGGLILGSDGNLYGVASEGGTNGYGTIFKITLAGTLTTLHNFALTDGNLPFAGLIQATDGNFYGTTNQGGANGYGTVFQMTPAGVLTTLHDFASTDGANPSGALLQATDGNLYGTTWAGGAYGDGTIFSISESLLPFVITVPVSAKVGANVTILGSGFKGTTSVTFDGTAATFTIRSETEITTTVPAGAKTGPISVVTPSSTLVSNVPFQVVK